VISVEVELKVDASRVIVILSKSDNTHSERIEEITDALGVSNPLVISSKTGYGIHKLKTMMADHLIKLAINIPSS
jgi:GTPase